MISHIRKQGTKLILIIVLFLNSYTLKLKPKRVKVWYVHPNIEFRLISINNNNNMNTITSIKNLYMSQLIHDHAKGNHA